MSKRIDEIRGRLRYRLSTTPRTSSRSPDMLGGWLNRRCR